MKFKLEIQREDDGRRIPEVPELPGVLVYGNSAAEGQPLALRVVADRLEHSEAGSDLLDVSFNVA